MSTKARSQLLNRVNLDSSACSNTNTTLTNGINYKVGEHLRSKSIQSEFSEFLKVLRAYYPDNKFFDQAPTLPPQAIRQLPPLPVKSPTLITDEKSNPVSPTITLTSLLAPRKEVPSSLAPLNVRATQVLPVEKKFSPAKTICATNLVQAVELPQKDHHSSRYLHDLGTYTGNPSEYVNQYAGTLVDARTIQYLTNLTRHIRPPNGERLAAESVPSPIKLVGDVEALKLISGYSNHPKATSVHYNSSNFNVYHRNVPSWNYPIPVNYYSYTNNNNTYSSSQYPQMNAYNQVYPTTVNNTSNNYYNTNNNPSSYYYKTYSNGKVSAPRYV